MLNSLLLNAKQIGDLNKILSHLEDKNSKDVYKYSELECSDCNRWDCCISCNCANSRD